MRILSGLTVAGLVANYYVHLRKRKAVVLDFGSNVGDGFKLLSRFFNPRHFSYRLYEPNDECIPHLSKLISIKDVDIKLYNAAVFTENCMMKLYGFKDEDSNRHPQGASLISEHNSASYNAFDTDYKEVECLDVATIIKNAKDDFDYIIVKIDIEGAELDVLTRLIDLNLIKDLDITFCEFHSMYMTGKDKDLALKKEAWIIKNFAELKKYFFIWN